nr:transposase [Roseomonas sp. GC11]
MERKAHLYRLYPTPEQEVFLVQWVGAVRFMFNLALEQRRDWFRPGRRFNYASQCREVTMLRAEVDWLKAVPVHPLQQALRDLDRAYQNWWSGRAGAPQPRQRGLNDAMRFPDPATFDFRRVSCRWGEVKLPKLGWIRFRWTRSLPGHVRNLTVTRRAEQWFISAQWEQEVAEPAPPVLPALGIDMGVRVFAALSSGVRIVPSNEGKKAGRALARAQRKLARKQRGSRNRRKAKARVARLHARVANARKDFLHKQSTIVAKSHGVVVVEDLCVRNMVRSAAGTIAEPGRKVRQKAGLNRTILDQGWFTFRTMLAYKLASRGGQLIAVDPRNTSRTCEACGHVSGESRNGLRFVCVACGHAAHADTNAARNILNRARDTRLLPVEASGCRADEAGTSVALVA